MRLSIIIWVTTVLLASSLSAHAAHMTVSSLQHGEHVAMHYNVPDPAIVNFTYAAESFSAANIQQAAFYGTQDSASVDNAHMLTNNAGPKDAVASGLGTVVSMASTVKSFAPTQKTALGIGIAILVFACMGRRQMRLYME